MADPKVALVTGGSRRIGRAIVEALAEDGWQVAIHANASLGEAEALAAAICAKGGEAAAFAADLADPQAVAALMPAVIQRFGPVTLLVNNASLFLRDTLTSIDVPTWNRQFSVNIRRRPFSPARWLRLCRRHARAQSSTSSTSAC